MIILKEKDTTLEEKKPCVPFDMLLEYNYLVHSALAKTMGLRPLPRTQWEGTLEKRMKQSYKYLKSLAAMSL